MKLVIQVATCLAGKEGEGALAWVEEGDDTGDESIVGLLLQVGLKADIGTLHLGCHVDCEVRVTLCVGGGGNDRQRRRGVRWQ